jgi:pyruvate-formate lyase-activating enzyme
MFNNFFKKRKYFYCKNLMHTLHFFHDDIRSCCTNVNSCIFYPNYTGEKVDWNYVYEKRKQIIKNINSIFSKKNYPDFCKNCFELSNCYTDKKIKKFDNIVDRIYFHYNMSCNAKCTYCTYSQIEKGAKYKVVPLVKDLIENQILSKNANVYMSGGEITISNEFEELLSILLNYLNSKLEILTSGIKYCKSIENAFIQNKCSLIISLDSACRETYQKIKCVDCFDKVVENLKNYIKASDNAKTNIIMKYIIVDGINDNKEEISQFLNLVKNIGILNVRLDFDYEKYKFSKDIKVPKYYFDLYEHFNKIALDLGLKIQVCEQIEAILNKSK